MVGCVGNDDYGVQLRDALLAEQIDCQAVSTVADSSGVALIVVDDNSQNAIVIVAGANGAMTPAVIDRFDAVLQAADVIICQLESGCNGGACAQACACAGQDRDPQPGAGQSSAAGRLVPPSIT
jgi:sugar/nucleoside kinase (ribokinase family)